MSGRCIIGFFSLRMKILDFQKRNVNKCVLQHPAYQVNALKRVLRAPDSSKFLGHPVV